MKVKVKSPSHVRLFATLWTVAHQAPPSMGFSRQEYWSGVPFPSPGDLPNPGIEPGSPTLEADALTSEPPGNRYHNCVYLFVHRVERSQTHLSIWVHMHALIHTWTVWLLLLIPFGSCKKCCSEHNVNLSLLGFDCSSFGLYPKWNCSVIWQLYFIYFEEWPRTAIWGFHIPLSPTSNGH